MDEQDLADLLYRLKVGETVSSTDNQPYTRPDTFYTGTVYPVPVVQTVINAGLIYVSVVANGGTIKILGLTNAGREAAK